MTSKQKDKYMFMSTTDAVLYLAISCVYPVLSYCFQLQTLAPDSTSSIHELMVTGFFFCAVYFYDFFSKFGGSSGKTSVIINILLGATILFGFISLAIFFDILFVTPNEAYLKNNKVIFSCIPLLALIPFIFGMVEFARRVDKTRKEKITAATV